MKTLRKRTCLRRIFSVVPTVCLWQGGLIAVWATTIVVIRTPTEVVIATDSAGTIQGAGRPPATETVCKIYQLNASMFFTVSGLVNDFATGFKLPGIVPYAGRGGDTIGMKMTRIENAVQTAVRMELPHVKDQGPIGYRTLTNSKGAVSVILAGIIDGVPAVAGFSLGLAASANGQVDVSILREACPGNCPSGVRAFWVGESRNIERLRAAGLPALGMPDLARFLVQSEVDAGTARVAGPVDVLRVLQEGRSGSRESRAARSS